VNEPADDDDPLPAGTTPERTAALLATVRTLTGAPCQACGRALCGHEAVLAVVLGTRHAPRCARCAAAELHEPAPDLCERSLQWIQRRDCFQHAWLLAGEQEGLGRTPRPACLFAAGAARSVAAPKAPRPIAATSTLAEPKADASYDAGQLGCGDLVLELRFRLKELPPGSVLRVTAHDPAAPVDLPAWCGLCGHTLLSASHPHYWIRSKA
jgi:tRNA 2-thiouridine synthesizing protein A